MTYTWIQHVDLIPGSFSSCLDSFLQQLRFLFDKDPPQKGFQMARKWQSSEAQCSSDLLMLYLHAHIILHEDECMQAIHGLSWLILTIPANKQFRFYYKNIQSLLFFLLKSLSAFHLISVFKIFRTLFSISIFSWSYAFHLPLTPVGAQ